MERLKFEDGTFWHLNDIKREWKGESGNCLIQTERGNFICFYRDNHDQIIMRGVQSLSKDEAAEWFVDRNLDEVAPDGLQTLIDSFRL